MGRQSGRARAVDEDTGAVVLRGSENPGYRLLKWRAIDVARVATTFHGAGCEVESTPDCPEISR